MGVLSRWYGKRDDTIQKNQMRVLGNSIQYDQKQQLSYLLYEMERVDESGTIHHFYKAIRLLRLVRVPKNQDIYFRLMEKHAEILTALWEGHIHFVTLIANLINPPVGLLFCYGTQGVGDSLEAAKKECDAGFEAMSAVFKGTFGTIELSVLNHEEMEYIRQKLQAMDHVSMFRGIPYPQTPVGKNQILSVDQTGFRKDMIENKTLEEFIVGMGDYEYVYMCLCTPISKSTLTKWLKLSSREATDWRKLKDHSFQVGLNISLPMAFGGNLGANQGWGDSHSLSEGTSHGTNHGITEGVSHGSTEGTSHSVGSNEGTSSSSSDSTSQGTSDSTSWTDSTGQSHTIGSSEGATHTSGSSTTRSDSHENSVQEIYVDKDHSEASGIGNVSSTGESNSKNSETEHNSGWNSTDNTQNTTRTKQDDTIADTSSQSIEKSIDNKSTLKVGTPSFIPIGASNTTTADFGYDDTTNHEAASSNTHSKEEANIVNDSKMKSGNIRDSYLSGQDNLTRQNVSSESKDVTREQSIRTIKEGVWSTGLTSSESSSSSHQTSVSDGESTSHSEGGSKGTSSSTSSGNTEGTSKGTSLADGVSQALTQSSSRSTTSGSSDSISSSTGNTKNITQAISAATTGSVGLSQGLSISHGYSWVDTQVENIVKMIVFQNERIMRSLNGQGAYYVDTFVATQGEQAGGAARALGKSAFTYKSAYAQPFQTVQPEHMEQAKLLYHMAAFTPCLDMEGIPGQMESYKWSTMLLPDEACALTHPPRVSEGGIWADVEDMPRFAVPSDKQFGEVYIGTVVSSERHSQKTGYLTNFKYCINNMALMNGVWQGESRSGKTQAAMRAVREWSNVHRPSGKRLRFLILDRKLDWRKLVRVVDRDRFRCFTFSKINELTLYFNLLIVPPLVYPQTWINLLAENFALYYKMNVKGIQIVTEALWRIYQRAGCLEDSWESEATEKSRSLRTFMLYDEVVSIRNEKMTPPNRLSPTELDAYERVLQRLIDFKQPYSIEYKVFNTGIGLHEILGDDDITVIEAKGLKKAVGDFVFGIISSGIDAYCDAVGTFMSENQYETVVVIEEANEVLIGQSGMSEQESHSMFETIIDQCAGKGLYFWAITQKIMSMPESIRVNAGIKFYGRTASDQAINWMIPTLGRNPRVDRELVSWFGRMPDLYAIVKVNRTTDFKQSEPVMVLIDRLPLPWVVETEELIQHRIEQDARKIMI